MLEEGVPDSVADHCHFWIGESRYEEKKYSEALQEFNQVLTFKESEKKADAQFMIGLCYERIGGMEKARVAFQKVVDGYPTSGNVKNAKEHLAIFAQYENALGAFESRKYAEAVAALQRMLDKRAPDGVADHCHYWIGESEFGAKRYSEAMQKFGKVLKFQRSVKEADAEFMIARCYEKMGDKGKAEEAYRKVVKDYPIAGNVKKAARHLAGM